MFASRLHLRCSPLLLCTFWCFLSLGSTLSSRAQAPESATLTGRVFNPATGEYVRNAEVRLSPSGESTISGDEGRYRFANLPAGSFTISVAYTGYRAELAQITLLPGQTVTQDFSLTSSIQLTPSETVQLGEFVVSSAREGNAKAIMEQRTSMNITNSVASDVFGNVAEGNVGEFLKHLPGVDLDLVEGEIRTVRLRGLGSEYTSVTLDGISLASADANQGASGNARAFSFEQVSLSSMESIEVSKTISADVDANAPAGTINLKSKRAFDREGRRITWQTNLTAFSEAFNFDKSRGPDDGDRMRKIMPGGIFEYSDVFLDRRLGIVLNVSESNVYSAISRTAMSYNTTPTAADPRPIVLTAIQPTHGPRTNERFTTTLTTDFKATPHLVLSLGVIYNYADLWFVRRDATFNTGGRAAVAGADPLLSFTTSGTAGNVVVNPLSISKKGETWSYIPKIEFKRGDLTIEGKFAYSDSESWYPVKDRRKSLFSPGNVTVAGTNFRAERSSLTEADWKITQVSGPDWSNGANYTAPAITIDDGRYARTQVYSGEINASYKTRSILPIAWKTGIKRKGEIRDFDVLRDAFFYDYVGPGAGRGAWQGLRSPYDLDFSMLDSHATSLSGNQLFVPNVLEIARLYREQPGYFTQTLTPANYYNAYIANKKKYEEEITAAFLMGTTQIKALIVRAGLRWEDTSTDSLEFDPRSSDEVTAAGYTVVNGRATTIPGIQYQYMSKPRIHRTASYDHLFPSASAKYKLNSNLDFHLGYSRTIRRPTFRDIAGVWVIAEETQRVSAPNPNLPPEVSDNFSARLAYYFEPVGIFAINFFQNNVEGLHLSSEMTAEEFGYVGEQDLSSYTFVTTKSTEQETIIRGMELEYSQSLSFLPGALRGLNVRASYSRNYAGIINPNMSPHLVSGGLSYSAGRFSLYTNANWSDDVPTNAAGTGYRRHRSTLDAGGSYRINSRLSFFFSARNLLNAPFINMQKYGNNPPVAVSHQVFGTAWTFGLKGTF